MVPAAQLGLIVENIGAGEIVVIAFLALVVLGPERLPEMARSAGRLLHSAKKYTSSLSGDMSDVINDPAMQPIRELGEFATRPRQKLAEYALEAEAEERQRLAEEAVRANAPTKEAEEAEEAEHHPDEERDSDEEPGPDVEPDHDPDSETESGLGATNDPEPDTYTP